MGMLVSIKNGDPFYRISVGRYRLIYFTIGDVLLIINIFSEMTKNGFLVPFKDSLINHRALNAITYFTPKAS